MSFIVTGNKDFLSKKSQFYGIKNIAIKGKTVIRENVVMRGDLRRAGGERNHECSLL
jgi:dynactin-5